MPNAASSVRRARRAVGGVVLTAALLPACTGGDDDATPTTTVAATTTTVAERETDGILDIGIYLPLTGAGASLGPPMVTGIEDAVDNINANGGVLGNDVELVYADEGSEPIGRLLTEDVDAIVGPASSLTALAELAPADAPTTGVVTCSPSATARALDHYPNNFFFRTAPSDSLQMVQIAQLAENTGAQQVAIGYLDDPYGRGLQEALVEALEARKLSAVSVGFGVADDLLAPVAEALLADDPRVVVVLGDADDGSRLLVALDEATDDPPVILISDDIRQARQIIQSLTPPFREQIRGVAARAEPMPDDEQLGRFVAHAIDCVNLIALAAIDAGTDNPVTFRQRMPAVSTGGRPCTTFEQCAGLLGEEPRPGIDYDGLSGSVDLSATGDPTQAWFETFQFDDQGDEQNIVAVEVSG